MFICAVLKHHSCRGPRGQYFSYIGNAEFVQYTSHSFSLGHSSPSTQHIGSATLVQCMSAALQLRASEDSNNTCNRTFTQHSRNTIGSSYSAQANRAFPPWRPHPQKLRDSGVSLPRMHDPPRLPNGGGPGHPEHEANPSVRKVERTPNTCSKRP